MGRGNAKIERDVAIEQLSERLERWRQGHKGHRVRIPKEFWEESARAAAKYGIAAVSVKLRLDCYSLKSRVEERDKGNKSEKEASTFVELIPARVRRNSANAREFQKAGGNKLRIEFEGELSGDLSRLSEWLWRAAR